MTATAARAELSALHAFGLWVAFSAIALLTYSPSLDGGWVLDDNVTIAQNTFIHEWSLDSVAALWDPASAAVLHSMNYAPVHLMAHAAEYAVFGDNPRGYRVVNLLLHALTAVLLVVLLQRSRLPLWVAGSAGALFLVHPANGEAIAAAFQLKTILSTALGLIALLLVWKRPAVATTCFASALLVKFSAVFALPAAVVFAWTRCRDETVPHWGWWLVWAAILVAVAIPEFQAFERVGQNAVALGADLPERIRSIVAISGRYLAMAATAVGVSAFHQPAASGWSDPWTWVGAVLLAALAWRWVVTLIRREEEAAYWMLAVAAFAPISQVFPFLYPMADRYLYSVLPGLLGGALLLGRALSERVPTAQRATAGRIAGAIVGVMAITFATVSYQRSPVFRSDAAMQREAARRYPQGVQAHLLSASAAAARGETARVGEHLSRLADYGFVNWTVLLRDPAIGPQRQRPAIRNEIDRMAQAWIDRLGPIEVPHQIELNMLAQAYLVRDELAPGIAVLERAIAMGGPHTGTIEVTLQEARRDASRRTMTPRRR